jgi:hypothetical protein
VPTATALGRVILWWAATDVLDIGMIIPEKHAYVLRETPLMQVIHPVLE